MSLSERAGADRYRALLHRRTRRLARLFAALAVEGRVVYGGDVTLWQGAASRALESYRQVAPLDERALQILAEEIAAAGSDRTSRLISASASRVGAADRARASLGLPPDPRILTLVQQWAPEQAAVIADLEQAQADRVAQIIAEGWARGDSQTTLARALREATGMSLRRATAVARGEVATLNARVTQERQGAAGITHYVWSTSGDERVRPEHRARDGQIFAWDAPPPGGHPGEDYGCRCIAEPHFED